MKNSMKKMSVLLLVGATFLGSVGTASAQTSNSNSYRCNLANKQVKKVVYSKINLPCYNTQKPGKTPTTKPVENPTTKPVENPTTKPVENPTTKPVENPTTKPVENPTTKPVENPTTKPVENPTTNVSAIESEVATLVNAERAKAGLKALTLDSSISNVARAKSQDMADKNYFSHTSPTYGSPFDMMKKFGINYSAAGENIAMGQTTAKAVMDAWMNSPGHKANILSSSFGKIGVGYVIKNGTPYWTQMFTN